MTTKRRLRAIGAAIVTTIGLGSIVVIAVVAARSVAQRIHPSAAELRAAPEVRALGHAHPIQGGRGKSGSMYGYRVELLDGRTGSYSSERLISGACQRV
jgi:hypothetical protein